MTLKLNLSNITTILACGDLHGKIEPLAFKLQEQHKLKNCVCFCAGDIGLGFHKENYYHQLFKHLNDKLVKSNNYLLLIRGNHDDPAYWNCTQYNTSNILLIPDYTMVQINGKNILCIGGAISVDRILRKQGISYWEGENFQYQEQLLEGIIPNVVITHSSPDFCFPFTKDGITDWMEKDPELRKDVDEERQGHTKVFEKLLKNGAIPSVWIYGHFHSSHLMYYQHTKFVLLNELELYEIK
ncbi:MAG TPA: metallophosphoesterase [Cytophagaceae bacterium]|jgi:predicted phosphodiesterase|nr:metallophosphoesterase [Cytophagaceae bacterium]